MSEHDQKPTADEFKEAARPLRVILARLGDDVHAEAARRAFDTVKDESLRSLESAPATPAPAYTGH